MFWIASTKGIVIVAYLKISNRLLFVGFSLDDLRAVGKGTGGL